MHRNGIWLSICIAVVFAVTLVENTSVSAQDAKKPGQLRQEQLHREDVDDFYVAQRLHLKFSEVPNEYCRTPAAVAAEAILFKELLDVGEAINSLYYNVNVVGESFEVSKKRTLASGAEGELASLNRISARLNQEINKLRNLPPCLTGYIPVFANGLFIGLSVIKTTGNTVITERLISTDRITNEFTNSHDPVSVGFNIAYAFAPWNNGFVVSPFVSFDYLNTSVNHSFPGGSYLGSTANASGTAGVKIGPSVTKDFWLYGIAGVSLLNETLNVNFLPVTSSTSKTVAGGTLGVGTAFKPGFLQGFGHPISLFLEYQHTWWQDAQFNSPAASAQFNYSFRRTDDVIKVGFNIHFDQPPSAPPASPVYPVKALVPK